MLNRIRIILGHNRMPIGTVNEVYFTKGDVKFAQKMYRQYADKVSDLERKLKSAKSKQRGALTTKLNHAKENLVRWERTLKNYDERIGKFGEVLPLRTTSRGSNDWINLNEKDGNL